MRRASCGWAIWPNGFSFVSAIQADEQGAAMEFGYGQPSGTPLHFTHGEAITIIVRTGTEVPVRRQRLD